MCNRFRCSSHAVIDSSCYSWGQRFRCPRLDNRAPPGSDAGEKDGTARQVTLDVIGLALFNYDFNALNKESPVIQAVYASLKETEQRATALLPIWKLPDPIRLLFPQQRKAQVWLSERSLAPESGPVWLLRHDGAREYKVGWEQGSCMPWRRWYVVVMTIRLRAWLPKWAC